MNEIIRLRQRGQITLPSTVRTRLHIDEGDFLEVVRATGDRLVLRPARLVTAGTPEAAAIDRLADADIAEGRYETFDGASGLIDRLALEQPLGPSEVREGSVDSGLVDALVEASGGDPGEALNRLWALREELAERVRRAAVSEGA